MVLSVVKWGKDHVKARDLKQSLVFKLLYACLNFSLLLVAAGAYRLGYTRVGLWRIVALYPSASKGSLGVDRCVDRCVDV